MITAASTADLMVLLVDATRQLEEQTWGHLMVAKLLHLPVLVCVNKMDLVDFSQTIFTKICQKIQTDQETDLNLQFIPIAALAGDNVRKASLRTPWYQGRTLMDHLEAAMPKGAGEERDLRLPIQSVSHGDIFGEIFQGRISAGDTVQIFPEGLIATVEAVRIHGKEVPSAAKGSPVRIKLRENWALQRGQMLTGNQSTKLRARVEVTLFWLDARPLDPERTYLFRHASTLGQARVDSIAGVLDVKSSVVNTKASLQANDIGLVKIELNQNIVYQRYFDHAELGSLILIDSESNQTVAAGLIT